MDEEIATAMTAKENAKAVGPNGLPVELLELVLCQTGPSFWSSTD